MANNLCIFLFCLFVPNNTQRDSTAKKPHNIITSRRILYFIFLLCYIIHCMDHIAVTHEQNLKYFKWENCNKLSTHTVCNCFFIKVLFLHVLFVLCVAECVAWHIFFSKFCVFFCNFCCVCSFCAVFMCACWYYLRLKLLDTRVAHNSINISALKV
jgi:hypothetical protein